MISKILVPIDGSEYASKALDWALELADKVGADIELLTVIPTTALCLVGPSEETLKENAKKILEEVLDKSEHAKVKPSLKISMNILMGRPAEIIIEASKEGKFDLIVIASRGLGGIKEYLLGSVADRVADLSQCPVVIVK